MPPNSIFVVEGKSSKEPKSRHTSAVSCEPALNSPPLPRPVVIW